MEIVDVVVVVVVSSSRSRNRHRRGRGSSSSSPERNVLDSKMASVVVVVVASPRE